MKRILNLKIANPQRHTEIFKKKHNNMNDKERMINNPIKKLR